MDLRDIESLSYVTKTRINSQSSLLGVVQLLGSKRNGYIEAAVVEQLLNSRRYLGRNDEAMRILGQVHKSHETVVKIWDILETDGPLSSKQTSFIISLLDNDEYSGYGEKLLANLLVCIHTKNGPDISQKLVGKLNPFTPTKRLITCLLVLAVAAPEAISVSKLSAILHFRAFRLKILAHSFWLANGLSGTCEISNDDLKRLFSLSSALRRKILYDLSWVCIRNSRYMVYRNILRYAITAGMFPDCELLIPLLARNPASGDVEMLRKFAASDLKKVSAAAAATLAQIETRGGP